MISWFGKQARMGWASTAITQSAFVRIISLPAFSGRAIAIGEVAELLLRNTSHPKHQLVALNFDFADVWATCTGGLLGHRQITDAWQLTAAIRSSRRLLTFDTGVEHLLASPHERKLHITVLRA